MKTLFNPKTLSSFLLLFTLVLSVVKAQSDDVILVDSEFAQKQELLTKIPQGVSVIEINKTVNPWKMVREYLEKNSSVNTLHLFTNTTYNAFELGGILYNESKVGQEFEFSMLEGLYAGTNIQLLVYDCNLGSNPDGLALIKKVGDLTYFNIGVPTNCTTVLSSDIEFDYTTLNQPITSSIFK
ncbi:MAG: DUF4347 domain-containing protein [Algicola sp.]|nr:DUF4347 domain-containing protein [Algicola sp.]